MAPRNRRADDRDDDFPAVTQEVVETLARVDPRELTDLDVHAPLCGQRFGLLATIGLELHRQVRRAGRQSRANAARLLMLSSDMSMTRKVLRWQSGAILVLAVIELFGREKGLEILKFIAKWWLG